MDNKHLIVDVQPRPLHFIITTVGQIAVFAEACVGAEVCVEHYRPDVFILELELMIRT